jgi:hypothetical protein
VPLPVNLPCRWTCHPVWPIAGWVGDGARQAARTGAFLATAQVPDHGGKKGVAGCLEV